MTYKTLNTTRLGVRLTDDSLNRVRHAQSQLQANEERKVSASEVINDCICKQLTLPLDYHTSN